MEIGYTKYDSIYILEIEVIDKVLDDGKNNKTSLNWALTYKILSNTNWITNEKIQRIEDLETDKLISNQLYCQGYHLSMELAICYELPKKYREIYLKNKTGVHTEYHDNGNIKIQFFHNNGIIDGESIEYYDDGKVKEKKHYINGKLNGKCVYYDISDELETKSETKYFENDVEINVEIDNVEIDK